MSTEWQARRQTFDTVADLYDQIRPGYPEQLFRDIIDYAELHNNAELLEIGCGTGQATLPFARRAYRLTALEPGAQLAAYARQKCMQYPQVQIIESTFEDFQSDHSYGLIFSATAFHWVDPEIRFPKIASLLKRSGTLAVWWNTHVFSEASLDFFEKLNIVYQQTVPVMAAEYRGLFKPEQIDQLYGHEFANANQFGPLMKQLYPWNQRYTAEEYIRLLGTYSDHLRLAEQERALLFERITALINEQYSGTITKGYAALLYMGKLG